MILPTDHDSQEASSLDLGAALLDEPRAVSGCWKRARRNPSFGAFARFVLALDRLFLLEAIDLEAGLIRRRAA